MAKQKKYKVPKVMVELVEEIFPVLGGEQHKEEAIELAKKDPEACILALLQEIRDDLWPKQPYLGIRHKLQLAASTRSIDEARRLLDEEEEAE